MADAFTEAGLLPEQVDLSDFFITTVQRGRRGGGGGMTGTGKPLTRR